MDILLLLVFVSLVLAASGVGLFVWTVNQRTYQHSSRLVLLPLEDDDVLASRRSTAPERVDGGSE